MTLTFPKEMAAFAALPATQVHDAYDADRDGIFIRVNATFRFSEPGRPTDGTTVTVPGFAMRDQPNGAWRWRVRWSPHLAGKWHGHLRFDGCASAGGTPLTIEQDLGLIRAVLAEDVSGWLVAPVAGQNPAYLRQLDAFGGSRASWLFGACRAWVVENDEQGGIWAPHEGIDRERDLFPVLRAHGYDALNQWMAPWEYLLIHRDRAEWWREANGAWTRHAVPDASAWSPWQVIDQGRAKAFDELVRQCEGGPGKPTIRLLLSLLPHQCFQMRGHAWGDNESGWSVEDDGGKQAPAKLNGFSAFHRGMSAWDFFAADPRLPGDDWRVQLFDHQANFLRYVVARWGSSRAIGLWVLIDELDAIGDEHGIMARNNGWWGHPACDRWLADVVDLMRGKLKRADGLIYAGDPYRHPLHVATTSLGNDFVKGGNLEWTGGPVDRRPDVLGWHWYPRWPDKTDWNGAWAYTIDGIAAFGAQPGTAPRLISEFGAPDRSAPEDEPNFLYPTLYHHGIWAAIFTGQAGTVMDWDDGKEFGEVRWRDRPGAFDQAHYPIDNAAQMQALRTFLGDLDPENLRSCLATEAPVQVTGQDGLRVFALAAADVTAVHGWLYAPGAGQAFTISGLKVGAYTLTWCDPWTGKPVKTLPLAVGANGVAIDAASALTELRAAIEPFPAKSRLHRGRDVAFHLVEARP